MFKFKWHRSIITCDADAEQMRREFKATTHFAAAFDTETTGLHHIYDVPFLYQFGWIDVETMEGYAYAVDLEQTPKLARLVIKVWHALAKTVPVYVGHNVKYDLHMCHNIGLPYDGDNVSDTTLWIRLGSDAIPERKGGVPLGLKDFASRYIDRSANTFEKELKEQWTKMAKEYNLKLRRRLGWTQMAINDFFKDSVHDINDLPEDKRQAYLDWKTFDLPVWLQTRVTGAVTKEHIRYDKIDRTLVTTYALEDIVLTLETFYLMQGIVTTRGNLDAIKQEEANIYPLLEMERVGFKADIDYVLTAKKNLKEYILQRRQDLQRLAGREISAGQHAAIKEVLQEMGVNVQSTGAEELDLLVSNLVHHDDNPVAVDFINIVQELRTLEKWYSTYIMRFYFDLQRGSMLYTTIHQAGTVSGRVTSDFQQFPKDAIKTVDGVELFKPRRIFLVNDGYKAIVYLDYSQIELRLQAMYTILVGHADTNLCRAYMPYKCHTFDTHGRERYFDYQDSWCIEHAYDRVWYYDEIPDKEWKPLDVHGATTKAAFDITEDDPTFHDLRYIGKRVNFAKNYGAKRTRIQQMFPKFDDATIDKIDSAYYKAFPGVEEYHKYCYALASQPYAMNCFGVRYFNVSGHNLCNMLVQGTGAYFLKWKIVQVTQHLKDKGYKSRFQMQIHDELSFLWHADDPPEVFFEIKRIMEEWEDTLVPIVADMEITYTTWAEKKEVHTLTELEEVA